MKIVTQNLLKLILACEDAYSKLSKVVTIADVDSEKRVDNSLVQIWKLKFGPKIIFFFQTLSSRFGQDFEVEVQARF